MSSGSLLAKLARQRLNRMRAQRAERTLQQVVKPFSPRTPHPKQRTFLELEAEEALYGGAAGGGKSDALLLGALQYVDVPGYAAILFRLTQKDLERVGMIKQRADDWFRGTAARWDDAIYGYRFPTLPGRPDATISFGYWATTPSSLNSEAARTRYQGGEWQYIGIDELTQWAESDYLWLFSRLRRQKGMRVPLRMRGSANPGGRGHDWVKGRFVEGARHVGEGTDYRSYIERRRAKQRLPEPAVFVSPPSKEAVELAREYGRKAEGAHFIPAFAADNPGLDVAEYRMQLARLDEVERRRLDEGDWDAVPSGKIFREEWFKYCELDDVPPAARARMGRYWDLAATDADKVRRKGRDPDYTAGAKVALDQDASGLVTVYVVDVRADRKDPGDVEKFVRATAEDDGPLVPIWIEEEPGSSGKSVTTNYAARVLVGWDVEGHKKTGPKEAFWKPVAALAKVGRVYLVRGDWNRETVKELVLLPGGLHDDRADAIAGCFDRLLMSKDALRASMLAVVS